MPIKKFSFTENSELNDCVQKIISGLDSKNIDFHIDQVSQDRIIISLKSFVDNKRDFPIKTTYNLLQNSDYVDGEVVIELSDLTFLIYIVLLVTFMFISIILSSLNGIFLIIFPIGIWLSYKIWMAWQNLVFEQIQDSIGLSQFLSKNDL